MKKIRLLLVTILSGILILSAAGCASGAKTTPAPASSMAASASAAKQTAPPSQSTAPASAAASASTPAPASASAKQSPAPASASASVKPATAPASPSASKTPAASASPSTGPKDYWAIGDALLKSDGLGTLRISMTEGDLIKALGQPTSKTDPELWGADGLQHSNWVFDKAGLKINMTKQPDEKTFIVFSITASTPCTLATQRGIKLGDAKDKVMTAYADAVDPTAGADPSKSIVAGSIYGGIIFNIQNGAVSGIFLGAAAE